MPRFSAALLAVAFLGALVLANEPEGALGPGNNEVHAAFLASLPANTNGQSSQRVEAEDVTVAQNGNPASAAPVGAAAVDATPDSTYVGQRPAIPILSTPLTIDNMHGIHGSFVGPDMLIHDNPESFLGLGVLGSTIGPVPGREEVPAGDENPDGNPPPRDNVYDFTGSAHLFSLAHNKYNTKNGACQFQVIASNSGTTPLTLTFEGVMYVTGAAVWPRGTFKDNTAAARGADIGQVPENYVPNSGFRGPQAIAGLTYLSGKNPNGKNYYRTKTVTIAPGAVDVAIEEPLPRKEMFTLLRVTADNPEGKFGLATACTSKRMSQAELQNLKTGQGVKYAGTPGNKDDFGSASGGSFGRANGVVKGGGLFKGGETIRFKKGSRFGSLVMPTRGKKAKDPQPPADLPKLEHVLQNPAGVFRMPNNQPKPGTKFWTATVDDAAYGVSYDLHYKLENTDTAPIRVDVYITVPLRVSSEAPGGDGGGGKMTLPIKVNGKIMPNRVSLRNKGQHLVSYRIFPSATANFKIEWSNFGNNFPPAGIEFIASPSDGKEMYESK